MSATPADRAALRTLRSGRPILSSLIALLVTALGVVVAAEVVSALIGRPLVSYNGLYGWAATTPWRSPIVLTVAVLAVVAGVALLVAAFRPGHSSLIPVHTGDPDLVVGVRSKSFTSALAHAAEQVPGVYEANAALHGPMVRVTGRASGDQEEVAAAVRNAVLDRMAALGPVEPYAVTVDLRERS